MKKIKWKTLIVTCIVTLIPMLIGIIFYNQLPEQIPVHFNIHNQPDNYTSKEFALFGIPAILAAIQVICCVISDLTKKEGASVSKFETTLKWWIPVLSILIGILLVEYPLRVRLDIRMYICIALGVLAIVTGSYFPKLDYESSKGRIIPVAKDEKDHKIFTKIYGITFIIFGFAIIISIRFNPIVSAIITISWAVIAAIEPLYIVFKNKKISK